MPSALRSPGAKPSAYTKKPWGAFFRICAPTSMSVTNNAVVARYTP
jgi:hypothetical protein